MCTVLNTSHTADIRTGKPDATSARRQDSQQALVFAQVVERIEHLDGHQDAHGDGGWPPVLEDRARVARLALHTPVERGLKQDKVQWLEMQEGKRKMVERRKLFPEVF
jgi:hypothetical protein